MTASHALSQLSYAPELGTMISILGRPPNVNINFLLFQYFFQGSCRGRKPRPECGLRGLRHLKEERENCRDDPKPGFRQPGPDWMYHDPWLWFPHQGKGGMPHEIRRYPAVGGGPRAAQSPGRGGRLAPLRTLGGTERERARSCHMQGRALSHGMGRMRSSAWSQVSPLRRFTSRDVRATVFTARAWLRSVPKRPAALRQQSFPFRSPP